MWFSLENKPNNFQSQLQAGSVGMVQNGFHGIGKVFILFMKNMNNIYLVHAEQHVDMVT